jgi:molecular chaperone HscB
MILRFLFRLVLKLRAPEITNYVVLVSRGFVINAGLVYDSHSRPNCCFLPFGHFATAFSKIDKAPAGFTSVRYEFMMTGTASKRFYLIFRDYATIQSSARLTGIRASCTFNRGSQRSFHSRNQLAKESLRPQNHYEFFPETLSAGPPPHGPFAINLRALRNEFLRLQAKAHPDMHSGDAKNRAEGLSMLINEAYKTLQDPLRRAQYLLSLRGIDVAEDETAKVEDPELLMEVLEMREAIEAVEEEGELVPLKEDNDVKIEDSTKVLDEAFKNDDLELAKAETVRLRYWVNIKESLHAWEKGKPVVLVH